VGKDLRQILLYRLNSHHSLTNDLQHRIRHQDPQDCVDWLNNNEGNDRSSSISLNPL